MAQIVLMTMTEDNKKQNKKLCRDAKFFCVQKQLKNTQKNKIKNTKKTHKNVTKMTYKKGL